MADRLPNPFRPGFGVSPPVFAGRDAELSTFTEALADGPGAFGRIILLRGQRGCGKTTLLNALEDAAGEFGWLVISETTIGGLVDRMVADHLPRLLADHDPDPTASTITRVDLPGRLGGLGRDVRPRHDPRPTLRSQLTALCEILRDRGSGVLITVDELHKGARLDARAPQAAGVQRDLEHLGATLQHLVRENREIAFVGAGLPSNLNRLLRAPNLTFLRRAELLDLGEIGPAEVERALREPIVAAGRSIEEEALAEAVAATHGYPFLIQLIGRYSWRADPRAETITAEHVAAAVARARDDIGRLVHAIAVDELPRGQRAYLAAMAVDDGPSSTAQIAARLGITPQHAGVLRARLRDAAELIVAAGHGTVDFALPYLRDYMRRHPAYGELTASPGG